MANFYQTLQKYDKRADHKPSVDLSYNNLDLNNTQTSKYNPNSTFDFKGFEGKYKSIDYHDDDKDKKHEYSIRIFNVEADLRTNQQVTY